MVTYAELLQSEGKRVTLYGDFGTVLIDYEPTEVRIRWDEGGSGGQLISPEWVHLEHVSFAENNQ